MRIGMGYDVHRLTEDRKLIIGGVEIPYEKGFSAIRMRMSFCMPSWMPCLALRRLGISESISPIPIPRIKESAVWSFCVRWANFWRNTAF